MMKHNKGGIHSFVHLHVGARNSEGDYGNHYHRSKVPPALDFHKGLSSTKLSGKTLESTRLLLLQLLESRVEVPSSLIGFICLVKL